VKQGASPSQIQFLYDTPIAAPRVVTLDLATGKATFSAEQNQALNSSDFVTEKIIANYNDVEGKPQTVPAFVSRPKTMASDGQSLSYYKIYGGFDVGPQYVGYSPSTASWLMNGGLAVDPVLPGDGGLGSGNYQEGLGAGISNTDLALAAIIQKLHDMGYTSPEKTGIYGRSNGGMAVNNMLNQRPNLIGAAVTESGVNSLFDSPVINPDTGQYWTPEFGDPQNPDQVGWMSKIDVINNLTADKKLPPTMVAIGTKDGVVNVGNGITYHDIRQRLGIGETVLYSRIGEGHDPVNLNLALQTAFLWDRLSKPKS
jgi:prolyl oligopeptidase